ncbi:MAG: STAS domain-containing protein [Bacteroidota bacterium]
MESGKKINLLLEDASNEETENSADIDSFDRTIVTIKFEEVFQERGEYSSNELAGIYFQGTQYFDFKNVYFINNTGIANLIDLIKSLLKQGVAIKFVNVREKIKDKFKSMGLEFIFNCS